LAESLTTAAYARRAALAVAAVTLSGGAVAFSRALVGVFYDDGLYAGVAVALASGQGYVHPHLPAAPAVIHYPPLYPLLLAPLFGMLSVDGAATAAKLLNMLLAACGAALIAWYAVRANLLGEGAPRWLAPACVCAAALAIPVLTVQSVLFAEPLFAVLLAVAVILADSPPARWTPATAAVAAGFVAALALLTRTIGVAAGAGIVLFLLLVRRVPRSRALLAASPVALAAAAWGVWTAMHRAGIDPAMAINYGSLAEVVKQSGLGAFGSRAPDLTRPLGAITLGWLPMKPLYYLFSAAALAVWLYGFWLLFRRSAISLSLLCYLAILAIWPFYPDRFLWAVLPWVALIWAAGAVACYHRLPRWRLPLAILLGVMLVGYGQFQVRGALGRWWGTQQAQISANFTELLPWVSTLPHDVVLATDDEALVWLYTHRTAVPFYVYGYQGGEETHPTPAVHRAYLERMGVTHILFSGFGGGSDEELDALIGAYPGWLTIVHAWSGGRAVFRVNRDI
jgi:hypothetical protein